jgi:hypothetical protein
LNYEKEVRDLIGASQDSVKVSLTPQLENRLVALGRRRFGTIAKTELLPRAVLMAAAYGVIVWEKNMKPKGPKPKQPISKKK